MRTHLARPQEAADTVTRPPTFAQLRNLADRAENGPLTPAEAARLRAGITAYDLRRRTNRGAAWGNRVANLRRQLRQLHAPLLRGGIQVCTTCSGWNGVRCLGLVTEWPCQTLTLFDRAFPTKENQ